MCQRERERQTNRDRQTQSQDRQYIYQAMNPNRTLSLSSAAFRDTPAVHVLPLFVAVFIVTNFAVSSFVVSNVTAVLSGSSAVMSNKCVPGEQRNNKMFVICVT